jgi:hypothetical protein
MWARVRPGTCAGRSPSSTDICRPKRGMSAVFQCLLCRRLGYIARGCRAALSDTTSPSPSRSMNLTATLACAYILCNGRNRRSVWTSLTCRWKEELMRTEGHQPNTYERHHSPSHVCAAGRSTFWHCLHIASRSGEHRYRCPDSDRSRHRRLLGCTPYGSTAPARGSA